MEHKAAVTQYLLLPVAYTNTQYGPSMLTCLLRCMFDGRKRHCRHCLGVRYSTEQRRTRDYLQRRSSRNTRRSYKAALRSRPMSYPLRTKCKMLLLLIVEEATMVCYGNPIIVTAHRRRYPENRCNFFVPGLVNHELTLSL
jgi:hypothetical protein